jgi:hypothetical protein
MALALSLVAATTLMAQAPSTDVDAVTDTPALRVQQSGGVQFLNGGAEDRERAAMRALHDEFPLQILFNGPAGAYGVANAVRVYNGSAPVLTVANAGPLLMVKVPPGRYTVEADFNGRSERRTISVAPGGALVHWGSTAVQ